MTKRSAPVIAYRRLINRSANRIFGTQQRVEVPPRHMRLAVDRIESQQRLGLNQRAKEGHAPVVGVEDIVHGAASEPDRRGDVTRIYVIQLGHGYSLSIFSDRADCAPAPVPVADRIVGPIASVVQRR